jgi:hypothetical protein
VARRNKQRSVLHPKRIQFPSAYYNDDRNDDEGVSSGVCKLSWIYAVRVIYVNTPDVQIMNRHKRYAVRDPLKTIQS